MSDNKVTVKDIIKSYIKKFLDLKISQDIFAIVLIGFIRFVYLTTFVKYRNVKKLKEYMKSGKPIILVFWHSRCVLISKFWKDNFGMRKHPVYGIFSTHRDGQLIGKLFGLLGVKNIVTSSKDMLQASKVVMKSLRILKSGVSIGFTPDGPVGPRMNFVSDSAFLFARLSGAPVVPVYISPRKPKILNSWDRLLIPRPFHRATIEVGDFLFIDKKISDEEFEKKKAEFEKNMVENTLRLDKEMGLPEILPAKKQNN